MTLAIVSPSDFENATAAHLYYVGPRMFPETPLTQNPTEGNVPTEIVTTLQRDQSKVVQFTARGDKNGPKLIGVAAPVACTGTPAS